jgi:hypothetical protein
VQRILDRAGITTVATALHPLAYRDRHSYVLLPLDAVLAVAQSFAAAEPQTVLDYLDEIEEECRSGVRQGNPFYRGYLRELLPAHAIARQWAGPEQEAEMLRQEIARLRGLRSRAEFDLRQVGQDHKAKRLMRDVDRP